MTDSAAVARLLGDTLAAHARFRIYTHSNQRQPAAQAAADALRALRRAMTLDPGRTAPAWQQGTPRDRLSFTPRTVELYLGYLARQGLVPHPEP